MAGGGFLHPTKQNHEARDSWNGGVWETTAERGLPNTFPRSLQWLSQNSSVWWFLLACFLSWCIRGRGPVHRGNMDCRPRQTNNQLGQVPNERVSSTQLFHLAHLWTRLGNFTPQCLDQEEEHSGKHSTWWKKDLEPSPGLKEPCVSKGKICPFRSPKLLIRLQSAQPSSFYSHFVQAGAVTLASLS